MAAAEPQTDRREGAITRTVRAIVQSRKLLKLHQKLTARRQKIGSHLPESGARSAVARPKSERCVSVVEFEARERSEARP